VHTTYLPQKVVLNVWALPTVFIISLNFIGSVGGSK
jgi:hypothetical protein